MYASAYLHYFSYEKVSMLRLFSWMRLSSKLAIVFLGIALAGSFTPAVAAYRPAAMSADDVVAHIAERNQELDTYAAHVRVEFRLRSFPYLREHLDGTAYFKRPSKYEVVFKRVPSYAKGFSHLSADLADASSWGQRFHMSIVGTRDIDGRHDLVLRLVQRVRGQIDHQDVAVNPQLWEVDAMEYHYYNGGTISMQQHFENIGGFRLITSLDAQIQIPYVKALAHADYTDYHTNVASTQSMIVRPDER